MTGTTTLRWALTAFALVLPVSIAGTNAALGAMTLLLLALEFSGERLPWRVLRQPATGALLAYLAVAALVSWAGVDPGNSFGQFNKDLHKLWAWGILLVVLSKLPDEKPERALAAGFAFVAAYGIVQALAVRDASGTMLRARAFVHPVTYGTMMAIALLGALAFFSRAERPDERRWAAGFLALAGAAFLLNQTRGAFLGLAAGFAAMGLLDPKLKRWSLRALAAGALLLIVWELLPTGRSLVWTIWKRGWAPIANEQFDRLVLWRVAVRMFLDHPWTGVGPGNYRLVFDQYFQGTLAAQTVWGSAHNLYLHQLAERGLLGFAALAGLFGTIALSAWRRAKAAPDAAGLWAWGSMAAVLVMNLTEVSFQNELAATLLFFVWARALRR